MTSEYAKLILTDAVHEAFTHYLFSPRLAGIVREMEEQLDGEPDDDCLVDNAVIEDFGKFLAGQPSK